jgi:polyhydroxybutyrate depolymerase
LTLLTNNALFEGVHRDIAMTFVIRLAVALMCIFSPPVAAQEMHQTSLGTYRIALPKGDAPEAGFPALLFFHGAGRSGADVIARTQMVATFNAAGWAVIAPDGMERPDRPGSRGWFFHPERPSRRDEHAFTQEVLDDAAATQGIDRSRVLIGGYSIGGSLAWYIACQDPTIAAAFVPVAGAFWRPLPAPQDCAGPVRMLHTHGWRDQTVPLEGRPLRNGQIYQGDVFAGLSVMRAVNGCEGLRADSFDTDGPFWVRRWTACTPGSALEFALHTGGHIVPEGWAEMVLDWLETLADTTGG